jgi:glycosyltransferase involved in cell wall biosynthesis
LEGRIEKGNSPIKILRIIPFLDFGGVEQRIKLTAVAFESIPNVELIIVVLGRGGHVSHSLEQYGIKFIILGQQIKIPNFTIILKLFRIIKDQNPNVVHCSGAEANFHGLIAAKWAGVPLKIGEEIGFPKHHLIWRLIFKMTYLCADKVIGISRSVVEKIVSMGEVPSKKTIVVYNPVGIDTIKSPLPPKSLIFTFITVCRLVPIKNLEFLLNAFSLLIAKTGSQKVHLHILGRGPEKDNLIELCCKLEILNQVFFLGYQENIIPYLRHADAFVLPSFSEGFSISLVEAMLCKLPCIVTKIGGPSEIIHEGKTGFLIDPYNIHNLLLSMENIYAMPPEERNLIGTMAEKDARERFSVDRYVAELLKVYKSSS